MGSCESSITAMCIGDMIKWTSYLSNVNIFLVIGNIYQSLIIHFNFFKSAKEISKLITTKI